ncbi:cupin domain-containing protein [Flavobacterium franklandianum]|nr:hypothetical protein [Flavobacterium franklandianum]
MGYDDTIMMVNVLFEKGSVGTPHEHYHSRQSTHIRVYIRKFVSPIY